MPLIETDEFAFEFLSELAERESWRKEIHRPIYHIHKWWAKRLGSVFRGILLGCTLPSKSDLASEFHRTHSCSGITVLDPFMGSGTTVGEAHKLGFTALGREINPVAMKAVQVALGPIQKDKLENAFEGLSRSVGKKVLALYESTDSQGRSCSTLYYFWVMQACCPECHSYLDLFSSFVIATNAYPNRKPVVQILCPACGDIFAGCHEQKSATCPSCEHQFDPRYGLVRGSEATCSRCHQTFSILDAIGGKRPIFRLYGKLVLTQDGEKEYLPASKEDQRAYERCSKLLQREIQRGKIRLPSLQLEDGYNTRQAINYGFRSWRDFFNDRQLLALGWLGAAIAQIPDATTQDAFLILFSGTLEFNNMFASYKGEGTGAVRHMFAHHILKPERMPIEANVWGTLKSSGAFSNLFRSRLLRALEYRLNPTEVNGRTGSSIVCSPAFSGQVEPWPRKSLFSPRAIYLSCGDSTKMELPSKSIDFIVTDPPFFDNVHYSELADFFYSWQQVIRGEEERTTRSSLEVQDVEASNFATKLRTVFQECHRVLKDDGLLVFTYHHSRDKGWWAIADAVLGAGFVVVNSHPVKSELSVAMPKSQAKEPIHLDIILVCRKTISARKCFTTEEALESAKIKLQRLQAAGFSLSRNDRKMVLYGQLLTLLHTGNSYDSIPHLVEKHLASDK
ncbi:adenine-specific DNA methylase [Candidatus Acetothermia bacterium]|nr:adenine-specific DNA methylase [Candidatus Acetothermia bacterium]MCI2431832.1 adenine-specific DNA methylase [Candidatus Acetothermia bacterium]MCI2435758.1 adenine-specific DNA methylase [Candidatus Acetothermia bacterium]